MLSFKDFLAEGNPLSRMHSLHKKGHHTAVVSAERSHLSPKDNATRHAELKAHLTKKKVGFREVQGKWEGGSEKSLMIHSKRSGRTAGRNLKKLAKHIGKKYGQDAVLHVKPNNKAVLHGTNKSGWPGKNKKKTVGTIKHGKTSTAFSTETKPGKKSSASFTTEAFQQWLGEQKRPEGVDNFFAYMSWHTDMKNLFMESLDG